MSTSKPAPATDAGAVLSSRLENPLHPHPETRLNQPPPPAPADYQPRMIRAINELNRKR